VERHPAFSGGNLVGDDAWHTYYLYSVERAGVASGYKRFGVSDWYRELATYLVRTQNEDGSWGTTYQTCFGVLALVKGRTPIVISKLKHGQDDDWNNDPRDAATLTRWLSRKLESPMTWQIVDLATEAGGLIDTPVLYISGHEAPEFSEPELGVLQEYVASGGTIVAVACCSRLTFTRGIEGVFDAAFPRLQRERLADDHPVWSIHYPCRPDDDYLAYSDGCRTRIFVIPAGVCCAWQQDLSSTEEDMFQLGANLVLYATGQARPRSVVHADLSGRTAQPQAAIFEKQVDATLQVGRIKHDGDFWVDPYALGNLSRTMVQHWNIAIEETSEVDPATTDLSAYDALWLTGHSAFLATKPQEAALRDYVAAGGTIVGTACCGRPTFDLAFSQLMESMYGIGKLETVPPDDPVISGAFAKRSASGPMGSNLQAPNYKRFAIASTRQAGPEAAALKGIRRADGSWGVLYSPIDMHCGSDGHHCVGCKGFTSGDARATAGNILLYVLLNRSK
jgi:hypothetical protein